MLHEDKYRYNTSDWGGSGGTPDQLRNGLQNAACVWASVCDGDKDCLARCPVAMGIAGMESNFNAATTTGDGGFGLWQVGGPSATAASAGFDGKDCVGAVPLDKQGDPAECSAYNPLTLGKWVRTNTANGNTWNPPGRCWSTCSSTCNPNAKSGWTNGWSQISGTPRPDGVYPDSAWGSGPSSNGGAQSYAMSQTVRDACLAAIESVYPDLKTVEWESPDKCMM